MTDEQPTPTQDESTIEASKPESGELQEIPAEIDAIPEKDDIEESVNQVIAAKEGRPRNRRRRKVSVLTTQKIENLDYKEVGLLRRFLNDQGKILPARQTGNTAKQQRMVARSIRRAREMALLPFVTLDLGRHNGGGSQERGRRPRQDRYKQERSSETKE